ncbi:MAG: hypothetical protein K9L30_12830 [Desulfobacterales bacterium]|nr:hypothetical protein [Desulfobacterales bacterium]
MGKFKTRMGDGFMIEMSEAEIRQDLEDGTKDAAERANVDPLSQDDLDFLFDIFASPYRIVGVEPGNECCLSYDSMNTKIQRAQIATSQLQSIQIMERALGADSLELAHIDYSYKPVKPIVTFEKPVMEQAQLLTIPPLLYGAMPNMGLYSQPDGPCPNPADLIPKGKLAEAIESYEAAIEYAVDDMVYVGSEMYESGADGINFDTTGAAGDAEFFATLTAIKKLKKKFPDMAIQMGMAAEFVLGMHGSIEFEGTRLAGLYPHQQLKLAESVGVSVFGPAVNIVTNMTLPWNMARSCTWTKAASDVSSIPIHACLGMGVGGVPLNLTPPIDALSRASKAHVEICNLDGL